MKVISSLELQYIIKEAKILEGGKLNKVFHPEKNIIILQCHKSGVGKQYVRVIVGEVMYLSEEKEEMSEPTGFCMFLRKKLNNAFIDRIEQVGIERIVKIVFRKKDEILHIYIELFGKGNIVVCDKQDQIISSLIQKKWTDRIVRKGEKYQYPVSEYSYDSITDAEFAECIEKKEDEIVRVLARDIHLGGMFAEEVCYLAELDKTKKSLTQQERNRVLEIIKVMKLQQANPQQVFKKDNIVNIIPFPLKTLALQGYIFKPAASLNAAYSELYSILLKGERETKALKRHDEELKKINKILDEQIELLQKQEHTIEKNTKKGDFIYEKYGELTTLFENLKKDWKIMSFKELRKKYIALPYVKDVLKDGSVILSIE